MSKTHNSQRKHTIVLLMLAVGMFGFAFALVPLYAKFCELTGLNGKTSEQVAYSGPQTPVDDRVVTIQFLGIVGTGMPWEFRPMEHQLLVRPGTLYTTQFYVRNRASQPVTGQAIPSVFAGPGRFTPAQNRVLLFHPTATGWWRRNGNACHVFH